MKIEIDFELLTDTQLSPDEYLYLYIVYRKGFNYLAQLNLKPDLEKLQKENYIKLGQTSDLHTVTERFICLFSTDFDQMFAELISKYPMKVISPGRGVRILHAKDPNAKANEKNKKRYKKIVNNKPHKHRNIIHCLEKQLIVEKDNLGYFQNLETWINNHTWEKYENLDENDTKDNLKPRITRSL
jgi:hypothetical protein